MTRQAPVLAEQEGTFEKQFEKTFERMQVLKSEYMITRKCELACDYCKIIDDSSLKGVEQSTQQVIATLALQAHKWPGAPAIVYGGEPTTRDDLPKILRAARDLEIKMPIISNSLRVMKDKAFREELVSSGLCNWSVSLDDLTLDGTVDRHTMVKSNKGLQALLMFRDGYGIRDLVVCVCVTRHNIDKLPQILEAMTREGIWSIFTPLHIGGPMYEYGKGNPEDMPSEKQIENISPIMNKMTATGRYLCSNDPEWFNVWPKHFRKQDWMCNDKGLLTIDADGNLKYCVDIPFRDEDRMDVLELWTDEGEKKFLRSIAKGPPCQGCLWNPAYECIMRARNPNIGEAEGRKRARHIIPEEKRLDLFEGAGKYFEGNPTLETVAPTHNPSDLVRRTLPLIPEAPTSPVGLPAQS